MRRDEMLRSGPGVDARCDFCYPNANAHPWLMRDVVKQAQSTAKFGGAK